MILRFLPLSVVWPSWKASGAYCTVHYVEMGHLGYKKTLAEVCGFSVLAMVVWYLMYSFHY